MKIGMDIHGCIETYPTLFEYSSKKWLEKGHEIHIITGQEWDKVKHKVELAGVQYTHHFSIVDYHKGIGTEMKLDKKGHWWMDETTWNRTKGDYIHRMHIDVHFDDSQEYAKWVPNYCTFVLVPPYGFGKFWLLSHTLWAL